MTQQQDEHARLSITIQGAVQGVGFRPFIFRLAQDLSLVGFVTNTPQGVFIEVEGKKSSLQQFLFRIEKDKPRIASIQSLEHSYLDTVGFTEFSIRKSEHSGSKTAIVLPDIATCPECLQEIFEPSNRRFLYPFTNCTNCGPRYTIIESLPYDRANTSMRSFTMCSSCKKEYDDPHDRRFHAQPNACPECGPHVELWNSDGNKIESHVNAIQRAVTELRSGKILAVKGIGGFHIMADPFNDESVKILRLRKQREEKPFALMFPSKEKIKELCEVSEMEERLLRSPEAPIVLLKKKFKNSFDAAAPKNPMLGVMLPYSPLHHILLNQLRQPLIATSGNISDEPMCIDELEAVERLRGIADLFLVHNRPIVRHADDSIVREMAGREMVMRRARGFAPLPIRLPNENSHMRSILRTILAVGAHLKNTVALSVGRNVFLSQHIGDLETIQSLSAFKKVINDFQQLYEATPDVIVCDKHPDYLSTKFAKEQKTVVEQIQHHYAHIASCMAENQLEGEILGVSWDGTGYGNDGTVWGGEFLLTTKHSFERIATTRTFRLPGGERAIKEPRRIAVGLLYEIYGDDLFLSDDLLPLKEFSQQELASLHQMLKKNVNAVPTSSIGRLFDGVASIIGLRHHVGYEGQAALELETLIDESSINEHYSFSIDKTELYQFNWEPMGVEIIADVKNKISQNVIATKFHNTLVEVIIAIAKISNRPSVALSGGCFQNKYLTERTIQRLKEEGFKPYWHQRIPPNDGGIALGQVYAYIRAQTK